MVTPGFNNSPIIKNLAARLLVKCVLLVKWPFDWQTYVGGEEGEDFQASLILPHWHFLEILKTNLKQTKKLNNTMVSENWNSIILKTPPLEFSGFSDSSGIPLSSTRGGGGTFLLFLFSTVRFYFWKKAYCPKYLVIGQSD